jgi:hypothetical protein
MTLAAFRRTSTCETAETIVTATPIWAMVAPKAGVAAISRLATRDAEWRADFGAKSFGCSTPFVNLPQSAVVDY